MHIAELARVLKGLPGPGAGIMNGSAEAAKGRIEQAAGALANNDRLRAKGQTDQAMGRIKQFAEAGVRQAMAITAKAHGKTPAAGGDTPAFLLPALPYAQRALEPHISARTLSFPLRQAPSNER
jgi:uncharacterized protein YjbJ (UPF0337 family)